MTDTSQEGVVAPEVNEGEGTVEADVVTLKKDEYEKLNQTLGSLKRELKDLRKPKEETKETPQTKPDDVLLQRMEKLALKSAGITHPDDVELARTTAKKWGMDIEDVSVDDDFKAKLERQQTSRSNSEATSGIRGTQGTSQAKNDPAYWLAKGTPPSRSDVPDRKTRAAIARAFMKNAGTNGKKFYNDI